MSQDEVLDKAIANLLFRPIFEFDGKEIHVIHLQNSGAGLRVPWWRGKEVNLLGVDADGNFFLRHCDGSVRYWVHAEQRDVVVAKSVKEFVSALREDTNGTLEWWKRKK